MSKLQIVFLCFAAISGAYLLAVGLFTTVANFMEWRTKRRIRNSFRKSDAIENPGNLNRGDGAAAGDPVTYRFGPATPVYEDVKGTPVPPPDKEEPC